VSHVAVMVRCGMSGLPLIDNNRLDELESLAEKVVSRLCKHDVTLTLLQHISTSSVVRGLCTAKVKKSKKTI
jgi:Fe-S oxidoreductase